jgi:tripartite-type tricarboxylate transporter receptor subunit TctC
MPKIEDRTHETIRAVPPLVPWRNTCAITEEWERRMGTVIKALMAFIFLLAGIGVTGRTAAQSYPNKPIRIIVPLAAGGQADVAARLLTAKLTETFKQVLVIDNRTGGGGAVGTDTAVRASPDGYTMLMTASTHAANAALLKLSYDPVNDVTPIALIGEAAYMVMLYPSLPVKTIKELIAYDKANPGKINYGSGGTGSTTHLATELFNHMAGTRMTHVPYKGVGLAMNDLLGGQIQLALPSLPVAIPQLKTNRVRGLAVTTAKRAITLPDIPTVAETVPGYESAGWYAVFGPKGLPQDIAARWNSEVNRILQLPEVKERMAGLGLEPGGGSPERLRELVKREIVKWQNVVKMANIKAEG